MTQEFWPRAPDTFRHLGGLRPGTYEGARQWPERVAVFRRAMSLLDPVERQILELTHAVFLRGRAPAGPGTAIYVPAGQAHRFTGTTGGLAATVIFVPPEASRVGRREETP